MAGAGLAGAAVLGELPGSMPAVYLFLLVAAGGAHLSASEAMTDGRDRAAAAVFEVAFLVASARRASARPPPCSPRRVPPQTHRAWWAPAAIAGGLAVAVPLLLPPAAGFPGGWLALALAVTRGVGEPAYLLAAVAVLAGCALGTLAAVGLVRSARASALAIPPAPVLAIALAVAPALAIALLPVLLARGPRGAPPPAPPEPAERAEARPEPAVAARAREARAWGVARP